MKPMPTGSIWRQQPRADAQLRLLCFPYAGAGANVYRGWDLGEDIELAAVQLPGREWRRSEPPFRSMDALVEHLLPEVMVWFEDPRPGSFFGYSMGAALAYALAQQLHGAGLPGPSAVFVAACRAPQLLGGASSLSRLGDDDFVAAIRGLGGMPDTIANEPALIQLAMPTLRADFQVLETHDWQRSGPLSCPLHVYGGSEDQLATRATLAQWRVRSTGPFQLRLFTGGHFFINTARGQLLKTLAADLAVLRGESRVAPAAAALAKAS